MERPDGAPTIQREVGARLRRRRCELGLSQEHVAYEVGMTQGSISNYEVGRTDIPFTMLLRICAALRTTPADLIPMIPMGWIGGPAEPTQETRLIA